jgi:predicted transcriptional regulator
MTKNEEIVVSSTDLMTMTGEIVSAYLSRVTVSVAQVPEIITMVHSVLRNLGQGDGGELRVEAEVLKPAVPIRKSVTPEYIVCLEDGKKLRMLKRYLRTNYSLSPEDYRARWGLPNDYPMVAPNYAKQRSDFAKQIGLGKGVSRRGRKKKAV